MQWVRDLRLYKGVKGKTTGTDGNVFITVRKQKISVASKIMLKKTPVARSLVDASKNSLLLTRIIANGW
jgi:hypothetical protein